MSSDCLRPRSRATSGLLSPPGRHSVDLVLRMVTPWSLSDEQVVGLQIYSVTETVKPASVSFTTGDHGPGLDDRAFSVRPTVVCVVRECSDCVSLVPRGHYSYPLMVVR